VRSGRSMPAQAKIKTLSQKYLTEKKGWQCGSSGRVPV
jgi:hypothetical protein